MPRLTHISGSDEDNSKSPKETLISGWKFNGFRCMYFKHNMIKAKLGKFKLLDKYNAKVTIIRLRKMESRLIRWYNNQK